MASRAARQEKSGNIQASQSQEHQRRHEQDPEWPRKVVPQDRMALGRGSERQCRRKKLSPVLSAGS
jgi:hypothetical protein